MKSFNSQLITCPCHSGDLYSICCKPFHQGGSAPSAELLMRSRYAAYVLLLDDYLLNTWHVDTRPTSLNLANEPTNKWLGLHIKRTESTGKNTAVVEFVARYRIDGQKAQRLHETSQFLYLDRWYYIGGI